MANKRRYHNYHNDWIRKYKDDFFSWAEMCKVFNETFGTDIERVRFKTHCVTGLGLRLSNYFYTEEQKEWLRENYPRLGARKITDEFNSRYKTNRSEETIRAMCHYLGLKLNEEAFEKFRKDTTNALVEHTRNERTSEIGTIGIPNHKYDFIKTENGWESIGRYLYKKYIGEIPDGYQVIFLDGDKNNRDVSNLAAVPYSYQAYMNYHGLRSENADITRTSIKVCELHEALRKVERDKCDGCVEEMGL